MQRGVTQGLAANETLTQITARIRASVETLNQAETIAQTASTAAFEGGQLEAFEAADVDTKMWLTQRDGKSRDHHAEADGQEVDVGEPFVVDGEEMMHPGDGSRGGSASNLIRCRCSMLPGLGTKRQPQRRGKAWRIERDAAMKRQYDTLRGERIESAICIDRIAEEHAVSARTVERALGWG